MRTEIIFKIVDYLDGTCRDLDEACESFGIKESDLTEEEMREFDSYMVSCDSCGWWTSVCDTVEDEYGAVLCDECAEDDEE